MELVREKIQSLKMENIKADVLRLIPDETKIEIWSSKYFAELIPKIKFEFNRLTPN